MANERAQAPSPAASNVDVRSLRDAVQGAFADASSAAVAEHLAAGRPVAGMLHGVPVTIVPEPKRDRG